MHRGPEWGPPGPGARDTGVFRGSSEWKTRGTAGHQVSVGIRTHCSEPLRNNLMDTFVPFTTKFADTGHTQKHLQIKRPLHTHSTVPASLELTC